MFYLFSRMNTKIFLAWALAFMFAAPALGTFDLVFTGAAGTAGVAATTTTIGGGTVLLGAILAVIVKAKILRELVVSGILLI